MQQGKPGDSSLDSEAGTRKSKLIHRGYRMNLAGLEKEFRRGPTGREARLGCHPRIPLRSIRGYFRFFPPGRRLLPLYFDGGWNQVRYQKHSRDCPGLIHWSLHQ